MDLACVCGVGGGGVQALSQGRMAGVCLAFLRASIGTHVRLLVRVCYG